MAKEFKRPEEQQLRRPVQEPAQMQTAQPAMQPPQIDPATVMRMQQRQQEMQQKMDNRGDMPTDATGGDPVQGFVSRREPEPVRKMTQERINEAYATLTRYMAGKAQLDARIVELEQWWKIRHWEWMQEKGARHDMKTASGWLFNVIISKHADGIQSIPEANILPREESDKEIAKMLSSIIACVLEQNEFDDVYSNILWQKLKYGTGAYGVYWDKTKLNGLGDIALRRVNLLRLFWEPGIDDIQRSRNVFYLEPVDRDLLKQQYPQLGDSALTGRAVSMRKFITEDLVYDDSKAYVIDWYYHTYQDGKKVLHYCKFVDDVVLYATEDELPEGLYDHGQFPFTLDPLFPVEGSPAGFGYIDVCKNAQEQIDILNQAIVRNALVNAVPRYFVRSGGSVNEEEFLDFTKAIVHVTGTMGTDSIMPIAQPQLDGNVVNIINNKVTELKETSGNTDSSNGITQNASQAASAIAALQEASGKASKDSTMSAYRAFCRVINQVIELIRQFYDLPRQFRITGQMGEEQFVSFDNAAMQPQQQGMDFGEDMGYRLPTFDVRVSAQTKTAYTKNSQNELAMMLYSQGIFNPQMSDQALMLLDMMDFDGKDELMQKISRNGTLMQQMAMYQQIALQLAAQVDPMLAEQLAQGIMTGAAAAQSAQGGGMLPTGGDGGMGGAMTKLGNARAQAAQAAQPGV